VLHVVQSGDTLLGISLRYGVSMSIIQKANDIPDPEAIKAGQQLVIPIGPTGTPTAGPQPTPTGPPKYTAPLLLSPLDGQAFEGNEEPVLLQWASVGVLRENEYYFVPVEQVEGGTPPYLPYALGWRQTDYSRATDPPFSMAVRVVRVMGTHADGAGLFRRRTQCRRSFRWLIAHAHANARPCIVNDKALLACSRST
jgi:LysM repeat protein